MKSNSSITSMKDFNLKFGTAIYFYRYCGEFGQTRDTSHIIVQTNENEIRHRNSTEIKVST
ncbi:CLUMA_CG003601, isoform A [Clunio marinus]|uniref:CLUMA_CG003601, isoform A n=1 Tax=Clunio marinus TaxID=568069 RepID=A0A1J1HTS0_9DIPT|nr:CLUMA_CG003601, isoform A [Clunio marinus]